jgi:hypothetical protein
MSSGGSERGSGGYSARPAAEAAGTRLLEIESFPVP